MPWLVISKDGEELDRREITEPVVIGRSLECDICIGDITLSRKHCRIEQKEGQWTITDMGSRNGTYVNGERVTEQSLYDGDVIRAADIEMTFRTAMPAGAGAAASRPRDPAEAIRQFADQPAGAAPARAAPAGVRERKVILPTPKPRGEPAPGGPRDLDLGSTMLRGIRMPIEPPEPPPLRPPPVLPPRPPEKSWVVPVLVGATIVLAGVVAVLLVVMFWA